MASMKPAALPAADPAQVAALRAFNRFYTRRIGVVREQPFGAGWSLAHTRVLWELAQHGGPNAGAEEGVSAAALARALDLDPGYLSRLLKPLKTRRLVGSRRSAQDARQQLLSLTAAGRRAFAPLDARSQQEAATLLAGLGPVQAPRLLQAMATIEQLLGDARGAAHAPCLLRPHAPGDIGWIIGRHGALYAQEYGLDARFEALVARIAAQFLERLDAKREACWLAERDGHRVGCVMLVQARHDEVGEVEPGVAQLRLLLVEPAARGLGLGERLVQECERFARRAGYARIRLWTQKELDAARHIYARQGYQVVGTERHRQFGRPQVAEVWEKALA
jgi:DNA-binding MarR family transcriptional regulator/ribosomal protein S18 acetylase RimI-like enzyme